MKILQIINSLNTGGAEKLIVETVPLMKVKGYEVEVLLLCDTNTQLKKELLSQGIKVWGMTKNIKAIYNPFLILKLIPILKKYDLVHVHLFPAQYWVALAKKIGRLSVPIVTTEHSTDNRRRHIKFLRYIEKYIYNVYDQIIAISKQSKINLSYYIGLQNKLSVILNGVDIKRYTTSKSYCKSELGFHELDVLLIMVSGFRQAKDQDTIIRSLVYLPKTVKLLLVGDGERRVYCESLARKCNVSSRVSFLGIRHDVPCLLKTADIVIMSSHYEGLSLSSIEGMSVGKPFVASNVPGLKEVTDRAGILFEQGNEKELAEHILQLMRDDEFYDEISRQCIKRSKQYDIDKMVNQLMRKYQQVLG